MMLKQRQGFTLIELLIVIVIIGILAAIAIPKFGATREKAYFKQMESDLRNLAAQQELHYSDPANAFSYPAAGTLPDGFETSNGVTVTTTAGDQSGWAATATHDALPNANCAMYHGTAAAEAPAHVPGLVECTDVDGNDVITP
jgi:prepilin-type N-terminal cleavage/methylation domain-containing protein